MQLRLRENATAARRVFLDSEKTEWMDIDSALLGKMRMLLRMQPDSAADIEHFFERADAIQGANCHKTSLFLTGKISLDALFAHTNHDPRTAGHIYVSNEDNTAMVQEDLSIEQKLGWYVVGKKFPLRITFFKKETTGGQSAVHSVTIIGVTNKGHLKGFEKKDAYADHPFQDVDIADILSYYFGKGYLLGVERQLT
jgi:hypothetical protein